MFIFSACKCSEEEACRDIGLDQPWRIQAETTKFFCPRNRSPREGTRDAGHVVCPGQCDALHPVLSPAPGDGGRHVRDGGPRQSEEREARDPHSAGGCEERGQDWNVGSYAGPV